MRWCEEAGAVHCQFRTPTPSLFYPFNADSILYAHGCHPSCSAIVSSCKNRHRSKLILRVSPQQPRPPHPIVFAITTALPTQTLYSSLVTHPLSISSLIILSHSAVDLRAALARPSRSVAWFPCHKKMLSALRASPTSAVRM